MKNAAPIAGIRRLSILSRSFNNPLLTFGAVPSKKRLIFIKGYS